MSNRVKKLKEMTKDLLNEIRPKRFRSLEEQRRFDLNTGDLIYNGLKKHYATLNHVEKGSFGIKEGRAVTHKILAAQSVPEKGGKKERKKTKPRTKNKKKTERRRQVREASIKARQTETEAA